MNRGELWGVAGLCLAMCGATLAPPLAAQEAGWRLTASTAQGWFNGGVRDSTDDVLDYSLRSTVIWGLGADHSLGKMRIGVGLSYLTSNFQAVGPDITLVDEGFVFTQFGVTAVVTVPVLRVGNAGAGLSLSAGPALGFWSVTNSDSRTTFGGVAGLQFAAPITPKWDLLATGSGAASGSPFLPGELPTDFERTTLWTWQVGIGARYAP